MRQVGIIGRDEGGFAPNWLTRQNASLVRALLEGNRGVLVSRWGHILLRRALASRLDAPPGMNPATFAALRVALLLRMGEVEAARALVQDVDTSSFTPALTNAAFQTYIATADFTGICPVVRIHGDMREDAQWEAAGAICNAFRGDGARALSRLDRAMSRGELDRIDALLAQRYAGAAGSERRAVTIEWDGVETITPWRYGLAIAVGIEPPEELMNSAGKRYEYVAALAPMLGLERRAEAADYAAEAGILSSTAMVDLYSQIYSDADITGDWARRAELLRDAYVLAEPTARLVAMQQLWNEAGDATARYSRRVLTAYAAARMPVHEDLAQAAPDLLASMLTAGLDRNAMRWANIVDVGGQAWALLALAAPNRASPVEASALGRYYDNDDSDGSRRSAFLLAGLAGLGRVSERTKGDFADRLGIDLDRSSRWTRMIETAADRNNPALVALFAGLGMQGTGWDKMTPRHLFHIVSALRRVGLEAEARMIAAEAVARA